MRFDEAGKFLDDVRALEPRAPGDVRKYGDSVEILFDVDTFKLKVTREDAGWGVTDLNGSMPVLEYADDQRELLVHQIAGALSDALYYEAHPERFERPQLFATARSYLPLSIVAVAAQDLEPALSCRIEGTERPSLRIRTLSGVLTIEHQDETYRALVASDAGINLEIDAVTTSDPKEAGQWIGRLAQSFGVAPISRPIHRIDPVGEANQAWVDNSALAIERELRRLISDKASVDYDSFYSVINIDATTFGACVSVPLHPKDDVYISLQDKTVPESGLTIPDTQVSIRKSGDTWGAPVGAAAQIAKIIGDPFAAGAECVWNSGAKDDYFGHTIREWNVTPERRPRIDGSKLWRGFVSAKPLHSSDDQTLRTYNLNVEIPPARSRVVKRSPAVGSMKEITWEVRGDDEVAALTAAVSERLGWRGDTGDTSRVEALLRRAVEGGELQLVWYKGWEEAEPAHTWALILDRHASISVFNRATNTRLITYLGRPAVLKMDVSQLGTAGRETVNYEGTSAFQTPPQFVDGSQTMITDGHSAEAARGL